MMADPGQIPDDVAEAIRQAHQIIQSAPVDEDGNLPDDPQVQKANQVLQAYQANTQPHYLGNTLLPGKFQPIDLNPQTTANTVGNFAHGVAAGVAEMGNPLAIPHSLETLARAPFQDVNPNQGFFGRLSERLQKASDASVTNPMDIDTVDRVANTLIKGGSNAVSSFVNKMSGGEDTPQPSLADIYDQEAAHQAQGEAGTGFQQGKTTGQLGALVYGGVQAVSALKGLAGNLLALKGTAAMDEAAQAGALNPEKYLEAKQLQKDLIGDLPSEMQDHLFKTDTSDIDAMLKGGPDARATLPIAEKIQNQFQTSKDFLVQAVGDLRSAMINDNNIQFDTTFAQKALDDIQNKYSFSGGRSALDSGQQSILTGLKSDLQNASPITPGEAPEASNLFTARDADTMIKKLDGILQPYYEARSNGQAPDPFLSSLSDLRQGIDGEIANLYPQFKQAKTGLSNFLQAYEPFQNSLGDNKAEGFVARLFGPNKGQLRSNFQDLLDKGKEAIDGFKDIEIGADTGDLAQNENFSNAVQAIKDKAQSINLPNSDQVVNEIINRKIASELAGLKDVNEDVKQRLIDQYISENSGGVFPKVAKVVGALGGGAIGNILGERTGGAIIGGDILQGLAEKIQGLSAGKNAKQYFTPKNLIDLIQQAKQPKPILPSNINSPAMGTILINSPKVLMRGQ